VKLPLRNKEPQVLPEIREKPLDEKPMEENRTRSYTDSEGFYEEVYNIF